VSDRTFIGALFLLAVLPLGTIGCGREGQLPTAATAGLEPRDARRLATTQGRGHQHLSHRAAIAEAKEGLGGVLTGEQVHYQRWQTFTDVPDTADFRIALGVHLGDLLERWRFSVSGASVTGFVATAHGRDETDAKGITVTLRYQEGQPIIWEVLRRGHPR